MSLHRLKNKWLYAGLAIGIVGAAAFSVFMPKSHARLAEDALRKMAVDCQGKWSPKTSVAKRDAHCQCAAQRMVASMSTERLRLFDRTPQPLDGERELFDTIAYECAKEIYGS